MFTLADFPIGSDFYWVRKVYPLKPGPVVYTQLFVDQYSADGELVVLAKNKMNLLFDPQTNPSGILVPGNLFRALHNQESITNPYYQLLCIIGYVDNHPFKSFLLSAQLSFTEYQQSISRLTRSKI